MGHSRTPAQNTAGDGFPADPIDGYVRASIRDRCHTKQSSWPPLGRSGWPSSPGLSDA